MSNENKVSTPDERASFEAWADARKEDSIYLPKFSDGTYIYDDTHAAWEAWQARAALAATPQNHIADAGKMVENVREGTPYDNPAFEKLARELGVWGTAQSAVCAQFWLAATPAAAPVVLPPPDLWRDAEGLRGYAADPGNGPWYTAETVRALQATGGQAQADMPDSFREWFAQNYPADTIIVDPDWHAKSIFRMAHAHAWLAAPQAQADARDAEQERWMGIGKAIERACVDLPAGAEINIHLEKDAGTVTLSDCDGDEQENFPTDEGLAGVVNAAIDTAIAAAKGEK